MGPAHPKSVLSVVALTLAASLLLSQSTPAQNRIQNNDATAPRVLPPAQVDWQAVSRSYNPQLAQRVRAQPGFANALRDLDSTRLPILLPDYSSGISRAQMVFYSYGTVYDVSLPQPTPGLTVSLSGTSVFVAAPSDVLQGVKFESVTIGGLPSPVIYGRSETGWTASIERYGMSYSIDVMCDSPQAKPYCDSDAYIRKVAASLSDIVLGAPAQREYAKVVGNPPPPTRTPPPIRPSVKANSLRPVKTQTAASSFVGKP